MKTSKVITIIASTLVVLLSTSCEQERDYMSITPIDKVALGKKIFFDKNLSNPIGQACASCHNPQTGFSDLNHNIVTAGAVDGFFGNRNSPMIAYVMFTPILQYDKDEGTFFGGLFLDGRSHTLQEQAVKPFMSSLEMNNTNSETLVNKLKNAGYYNLYLSVYGKDGSLDKIVNNIADAVAAYEKSFELNSFSSKFDYYMKGESTLTAQEARGLLLFKDEKKGNCAACHVIEPDEDSGKILFTDFTYDNIGIPKNNNNPFYTSPIALNPAGFNAVDLGLGATVNDAKHNGKFKVPTLRNSAISAPYGHNGYFNTLEEVVRFYNRRDLGMFPAAEIPETMNRTELGKLGLTDDEEKDIVAFMKTLTDGFK